jgi:pyruvate/2-oxoglutarate dehydrogenase complex dihydrolipoamide acyltransferase (E2) component
MLITVNGAPIALEAKDSGSLGELLAEADELLDKAGSIIVSLTVDGEDVDAEGFARCAGRPNSSVERVEIRAEDAAAIRMRALDTLLELLAIAKRSAEDTAAEATPEGAAAAENSTVDWAGLRKGAEDMRDAFSGLFAADELSFVQLFADILERAGDRPDKASRIELSAQSDRLSSVFGERLAELRSPVGEMRGAAALFDDRSPDLAEIPILLQTGKEDRAMKTVLFFIEVFNKIIRIIPELRRSGIDTSALAVNGATMPEFYGSFNEVLRQLTDAFEHKDSVLIGDLAEYEILPRMKSFFAAMREALPES